MPFTIYTNVHYISQLETAKAIQWSLWKVFCNFRKAARLRDATFLKNFNYKYNLLKNHSLRNQYFWKRFLVWMPLVAASDESIHTLNTSNIFLLEVNNRSNKGYVICSIDKDTKATSDDVVLLSSLLTLNRFQTLV